MRQRDFSLGRCIERRCRWQRSAALAQSLELIEAIVECAMFLASREQSNISLLLHRRCRISSVVFNLNSLSDNQLLTDFRFKLPEIKFISARLGWSGVTERNRYVCDPVLACAIMMFRLATTQRWYESEVKFGMFSAKLSEFFWENIELLVNKFGDKLSLRGELLTMRSEMYADAIRDSGAPLDSCVGFIDGTKIRMLRPGGDNSVQRSCYSGHKRMHCLNYKTLCTPDGLIFALYGPVEGRRHDLTLFNSSEWAETLQVCLSHSRRQFYIFGDQAYLLRPWLLEPYCGNLTADETQFNAKMSSVRGSDEHGYKDLKQFWISQDFARI